VYWGLPVFVVAVVVVTAAWIRVKTESVPVLTTTRLLATSVTLPGTPLAPAWPATGEAAFAVPGVGSMEAPGSENPAPIASVAKVMTAYLILRDHPIASGGSGFQVTVTRADVDALYQANAQDESTVAVAVGEQLTEYQLLEGLLIPSANNFADILASYDAGSDAAFVTKMNTTARQLGLTATTYTDPSGFAETTVSTAADQTRVAEVAMANRTFAQIVSLPSARLPVAGTVTNFDTLIGSDGFVGIKTGSDSHAGGCFMFAAAKQIDGKTVTVYGVILGQDVGVRTRSTLINAALTASQHLADSVLAGTATVTVLPAGTPTLRMTNAQGARVTARTTGALTRLAWPGTTVPLSMTVSPPGHTVRSGEVVATVTAGGTTPSETSARASADMPPVTTGWKLKHLL
jgi:serine-type D-Ala-D-Ala carboxypeptidase (penicillin-binding protein 5/6)